MNERFGRLQRGRAESHICWYSIIAPRTRQEVDGLAANHKAGEVCWVARPSSEEPGHRKWSCERDKQDDRSKAVSLLNHVLCAPFHDPIGVQFFAVRARHVLNRVALAQCACCYEGIVPRRQQSGPFEFRISILKIMNGPVLRFAHLPCPRLDNPTNTDEITV